MKNRFIFIVTSFYISSGYLEATAQETARVSSGYEDCTEIDMAFDDLNQPITASERSQLRRREITQSLIKSDACKKSSDAAGGSGAGGGGGSGGGGSVASASNSNGSVDSNAVPSTSMSGTELNTEPESDSNSEYAVNEESQPQASATRTTTMSGVGRAPLDIPPVATDDLVAQQLREAAMRQTDPAKQQALWDKYRQYKGIKVK